MLLRCLSCLGACCNPCPDEPELPEAGPAPAGPSSFLPASRALLSVLPHRSNVTGMVALMERGVLPPPHQLLRSDLGLSRVQGVTGGPPGDGL